MYKTEIFLFSRRFSCTEEKSPYTDSTMPGGQYRFRACLKILLLPLSSCMILGKLLKLTNPQFSYP